MEYRRGCIPQEYRRRGRPARLARFRRFRSGLGATHVTHDDDNLRAASTSTSAAFASSERSMRWTNSWGRGLNRSAGRAPGHCVLRWGQDVPSFPHAPFLAPALFLRFPSETAFGFAGILIFNSTALTKHSISLRWHILP